VPLFLKRQCDRTLGECSCNGDSGGPMVTAVGDEYYAGLLTQGGGEQGGQPAPFARRFLRNSTNFPLNLHVIHCTSPVHGPPG
jgi:hypothetical protein